MELDRTASTGLRQQIVEQVRGAVERGVLLPDDPLPSTRALAEALAVSRTTALEAYLELEGDGWVYGVHGAGTFVAHRPAAAPAPTPVVLEPDDEPELDLRAGTMDPGLVPDAWRAAWRAVSPRSFAPDPCGDPALRSGLAAYLSSARGLPCRPEEIVVCAGASEAVTVLGLALGWAGRAVAFEDPGYADMRDLVVRLGARHVPLPVDAAAPVALALEHLTARGETPAAVYLTPSHQFPLGHRLEEDDRRAVLAWARRSGSVVVEDDYDGEFRFGVPPLPSLAGLDPDAPVVYLGTLSKVLDPSLRLAYLRVPPALLPEVVHVRGLVGATVSGQVQEVVAGWLASGALSRHIARVRRVYADRRAALLRALEEVPGVVGVRGIEAGLHVVADLAPGIDAAAVVAQARERGVAVTSLDDFRSSPPGPPALLLHHGGLDPQSLREAVRRLAGCAAMGVRTSPPA
ncbi:PLP-dependent aminotransferase family protein [Nocardioides sp. GY 10127]|nr:PLP-dependent aminotransferase family protein [Nocardioides sp. GY 10127]